MLKDALDRRTTLFLVLLALAAVVVPAANLMADLRKRNERAQRRLRELKDARDRAGKIADILSEIDKGLGAVLKILP